MSRRSANHDESYKSKKQLKAIRVSSIYDEKAVKTVFNQKIFFVEEGKRNQS